MSPSDESAASTMGGQDSSPESGSGMASIFSRVTGDIWGKHNAIASRFDTRVRFWGKVVDQDGAPMEGVNIVATVTTLRMVKTKDGYREYQVLKTQSAVNGTFMFDGEDGMYLDIEALGKEGYVLPSAYQFGMSCASGAKYRYRYSSIGNLQKVYTPNPARPEVFHLWKLKNPEPLEIAGDRFGSNGPELKVGDPPTRFRTISMMVTDVGTAQVPQWEVTISALEPDGGVMLADPSDIFMFEAPESGYTQTIKMRYGLEGTDEMQSEPGAPLRFFVRSNSGRWHCASDYSFFSPNTDGVVATKMRYWRNPNGSRNLEHDGAHPKDISTGY